MSYVGHINQLAIDNGYFRQVVFTGAKSQLEIMDIKPGEDIGEETHEDVEQSLYCLSGAGESVLNGAWQAFIAGDLVVVTPGTKHNFVNTGKESLKIITIYVPANHIDGRVHKTRAATVADEEDEEFGHRVE